MTNVDLDDIGITKEQLAFIRTIDLGDVYAGAYTSIYFRNRCILIQNNIPADFSKVISGKLHHVVMESYQEENYDLTIIDKFDTRPYRTIKPEALVCSYQKDCPSGERIIVHRNLTTPLSFIQYKYKWNLSLPLLLRVDKLCKYSEEFLVSNRTIRDILNIKS